MSGRQSMLVAALLLSLLIAGFFSCFERKTIEMPTPVTLEAARNRYLASSRLLEAMGHEVVMLEGVQSLAELPPQEGTLIITTNRRLLTERRSDALLTWVEGGGHLIVRQQAMLDEDDQDNDGEDASERDVDRLLDPFGLRAVWAAKNEDEDPDVDAAEALSDAVEEGLQAQGDEELAEEFEEFSELWRDGPSSWDPGSGTIGDGVDLEVAFERRRWELAELSPVFSIRGPVGLHLVTLEHGAGYLTAVTDEWFLLNHFVGDHDHAEALVQLARLGGRRGPVYIMLSEGFPGLASQVLKYAMPAAVSLLVLVLVWLWRAAPRFGPVAPDPALERRQWIEHLEAVGDFHWRNDRASQLIHSMRCGVLRLIETRHPIVGRLSPNDRDLQLAAISGLHSAAVHSALDEREFPSAEANVARTISNLERIRSSL